MTANGYNRRHFLATGVGLAGSLALSGAARAAATPERERHGLSTFGELALPADFPHFGYVNPQAPKGGTLALQVKQASGNQNLETFDTLNIFTFKGNGAAGMDMVFDTLMTGSGDEPDSMYGLVARAVTVSDDRLTYRFLLRPEARFHDGSALTAEDAAFSLMLLKEKGHPTYRQILTEMTNAVAEDKATLVVTLSPQRSRSLHLVVAGLPILSTAYWKTRDFEASTLEAPLGSGPYKVGRFEAGRHITFDRVEDYWARGLPVNIGQNNFANIRYEYFRDRQVAFEGFKAGAFNYHEEYTSIFWATGYDFPAIREGKVKRESLPNHQPPPTQGWQFNTRRDKFKDRRIREAIGYAFDFEWTNANIMYGSYKRLTSYFENTPMKAEGLPSPEELALLEPFRAELPRQVFGEPPVPPVSDGSGSDRKLLRKANDLLLAAGCKRDGSTLRLPDGAPFTIEFLDAGATLQPHTRPFEANLGRLGIQTTSRLVDPVQFKARTDSFDFDIIVSALGGTLTPGDGLQMVYGSRGAKTPGSRNYAGIADPCVDALIARIAKAESRAELDIAARALDRVLRAGFYQVPMWYRDDAWIAYWDIFSRPATQPKFGTGAPGTWWYDEAKAKRIGL